MFNIDTKQSINLTIFDFIALIELLVNNLNILKESIKLLLKNKCFNFFEFLSNFNFPVFISRDA